MLSIGTPKTINFPFVPNGKLMVLGVPIFLHPGIAYLVNKTNRFHVQEYYKTILLKPKSTVNILKIGTPEIITIIVLQMEQLDFTVQYCIQKIRQNNKQRRP